MMNLNQYNFQVIIQLVFFFCVCISINFKDELKIPDGGVPLTPDQASILTHFLYESNNNEEQLHHVLISIANASTFKES